MYYINDANENVTIPEKDYPKLILGKRCDTLQIELIRAHMIKHHTAIPSSPRKRATMDAQVAEHNRCLELYDAGGRVDREILELYGIEAVEERADIDLNLPAGAVAWANDGIDEIANRIARVNVAGGAAAEGAIIEEVIGGGVVVHGAGGRLVDAVELLFDSSDDEADVAVETEGIKEA